MWRQFLAAAACLVATAQAVVISDQVSVTGDGNFNFEVLGSLCIPESVTATVTVQTQGVVSGVTPSGLMLVFNQTSLHSLFSDGSTCGQQSDYAECLDTGGSTCVTSLSLGTTEVFTYSTSATTELFFVVWDCNPSDHVDIDFGISSTQAEDCSALRTNPHAVGYAVAIVLLCIINLGLVVLTMVFWKRKEQLASIEI